MKSRSLGKVISLVVASCILACAPATEDIVKVSTVEVEDVSLSGIKKEDREKISKLTRAAEGEKIENPLDMVAEETPRYTVDEYLDRYPIYRGQEASLYRVGKYDVLDVSMYGEQDLSIQSLRVSGDGFIPFPLIGRVPVGGKTPSQIEEMISRKLAEGEFLLDAQVSVSIEEYNSQKYSAFGEIKNSGTFPLKADERLMDAISSMGGIDFDTAGKKAIIIRTEPSEEKNGHKVIITVDLEALLKGNDPDANLLLIDKDVIYVPEGAIYYMIGQIHKPGSYRMPEDGITLVEALGTAGGFTHIASRNRTRIIRVEDGVEKIITVNVDAITEAGRKIHDVTLKPGDIIVVPESFF